jgi:oligoendopeptidase F
MSAALQLSRGLLSGDTARQQAYLGFLKAGDSKDVLDIMRDAGVDLATPEPVNAALGFFRETVQNLRAELRLL